MQRDIFQCLKRTILHFKLFTQVADLNHAYETLFTYFSKKRLFYDEKSLTNQT